MTSDISCRSLIEIGLQMPRWRTQWLPCKFMAVSQACIFHFKWYSLLRFPYASVYAGLSCLIELCIMTADISCRDLTQIRLQYFISIVIAYCISSYASFYASFSCRYKKLFYKALLFSRLTRFTLFVVVFIGNIVSEKIEEPR